MHIRWSIKVLMLRAMFCALLLCGAAAPGFAADITDVADSFDYENKNPFDARFRLSYEFFSQTSNIYREKAHPTKQFYCYGRENGCINPAEYAMSHIRHTMNLRVQLGLYKDLEFLINIPLIMYESVSATMTDDAQKDGSSLRADGLIADNQVEARHTSVFGDMSLGFRWGPLNDARDPTSATWVLGFIMTLPTGSMWNPNKLKPDAQNSNLLTDGGVGSGFLTMSFVTSLSKRVMFADPYVEIRYNLSLPVSDDNRKDLVNADWLAAQEALLAGLRAQVQSTTDPTARETLTKRANSKQSFINNALQQSLTTIHSARLIMGSEFIFFEKPMQKFKISLDLRFVMLGTFQGRSATPFSSIISTYRPTAREGGADIPERASLITDHDDFFTIYFQPALDFRLGKYGYIRVHGQFGTVLPFFVSQAKRGTDINQNGFVDLGTDEVHPFHVRTIDGVGKRISQRDTLLLSFQFSAGLTF